MQKNILNIYDFLQNYNFANDNIVVVYIKEEEEKNLFYAYCRKYHLQCCSALTKIFPHPEHVMSNFFHLTHTRNSIIIGKNIMRNTKLNDVNDYDYEFDIDYYLCAHMDKLKKRAFFCFDMKNLDAILM
jgi:hypothetical protein